MNLEHPIAVPIPFPHFFAADGRGVEWTRAAQLVSLHASTRVGDALESWVDALQRAPAAVRLQYAKDSEGLTDDDWSELNETLRALVDEYKPDS